ncbi:unnamed protein product [Closterium sp. Naga37s-1]|nr:unnamed protein product [Closterium sp. Naga37s-1]
MRFMELQHILHETSLEVQGIKDVRWLARADAIRRLVAVLPAAIVVLWEHDKKAYATVTSFKFHFFLFFLADVLKLLNELNLKFQRRTVDITRVASMVHNTCNKLKQRYIEHGVNYAEDSELLTEFLEKNGPLNKREVTVKGMDGEGSPVTHTFKLHEDAIKGQKSKGDNESCITATSLFAQEVVKHLLKRMESLDTLSGSKLFLPDAYPDERAPKRKAERGTTAAASNEDEDEEDVVRRRTSKKGKARAAVVVSDSDDDDDEGNNNGLDVRATVALDSNTE